MKTLAAKADTSSLRNQIRFRAGVSIWVPVTVRFPAVDEERIHAVVTEAHRSFLGLTDP